MDSICLIPKQPASLIMPKRQRPPSSNLARKKSHSIHPSEPIQQSLKKRKRVTVRKEEDDAETMQLIFFKVEILSQRLS